MVVVEFVDKRAFSSNQTQSQATTYVHYTLVPTFSKGNNNCLSNNLRNDFSLHYPWAEDGEQQTRPYIIVPGSWKNITNTEKPPYEIRSGKSDVQYCTTQYHVNSGMLHFIIIRLKQIRKLQLLKVQFISSRTFICRRSRLFFLIT